MPSASERVYMLSGLSQQVTLAAIEAARGRAWMLHAAGIATPDGQVVVLVGPSGRGKTTASRALGAAYGYVSDETVAIDDDGRVWPYRKPLSVIEDPAAPKTQLPPSALGLQPLPDAELRVAAVVLLDRDPSHPEAPTSRSPISATRSRDSISQTSFLHDQPAALRFIAALATATGGIRTVKYREAATLPFGDPRARAPGAADRGAGDCPRTRRRRGGIRRTAPRVLARGGRRRGRVDDPDRIGLLTISEDRQGHVTAARRDRPGGMARGRQRDAAAADGCRDPRLRRARGLRRRSGRARRGRPAARCRAADLGRAGHRTPRRCRMGRQRRPHRRPAAQPRPRRAARPALGPHGFGGAHLGVARGAGDPDPAAPRARPRRRGSMPRPKSPGRSRRSSPS